MNQSIFTEFCDENHSCSQSHLRSFKNTSPVRSREQLYIHRLEIKVKQLRAQIKKNKPILDQIKAQRKFFKKISDKQRIKIDQINIPLIREEYEQQIHKLQKEKAHLQDLISIIHQESGVKANDYIEAKQGLQVNQEQLKKMLIEIVQQNQEYAKIVEMKERTIEELNQGLKELKDQLNIKQRIKTRYEEVMKLIGELQQRRANPNVNYRRKDEQRLEKTWSQTQRIPYEKTDAHKNAQKYSK